MVPKTMEWVSIMALLLMASWCPSANYQILVRILICAAAVMVVLALFLYQNAESKLTTPSITDRARGSKSL